MKKEKSYSGKLGEWQRLLAPVAANAADLPHLEGPRVQLEAFLAQGLDGTKAQATHTAAKQEISKHLKEVAIEGDRLATLLRVAIKQHYGIRSEKLAEFGMQPFRGRKSKPQPPGTPGDPPSPPPTSAPPPIELQDPTDPAQ